MIKAVQRYTGAVSVEITEGNSQILIEAIDIVNQDELQQIKDSIAAGIGLYFISIPIAPFRYDVGVGYDLGKYANVVTTKGVK